MNQGHSQNQPLPGLPLGGLPFNVVTKQAPQWPPEIVAAMRDIRDKAGGRYMLLLVSADESSKDPHNIRLRTFYGGNWSRDWLWRTYQLIAAEILKLAPFALEKILASGQAAVQPPVQPPPVVSPPLAEAPRDFSHYREVPPEVPPEVEVVDPKYATEDDL